MALQNGQEFSRNCESTVIDMEKIIQTTDFNDYSRISTTSKPTGYYNQTQPGNFFGDGDFRKHQNQNEMCGENRGQFSNNLPNLSNQFVSQNFNPSCHVNQPQGNVQDSSFFRPDLENEKSFFDFRYGELMRREADLVSREHKILSEKVHNMGKQQVLQPLLVDSIIPSYDPGNTCYNVRSWLEQVDNLREIYGWSDVLTVHYASLRLKGTAYLWYKNIGCPIRTFGDFRKMLEDRFRM